MGNKLKGRERRQPVKSLKEKRAEKKEKLASEQGSIRKLKKSG